MRPHSPRPLSLPGLDLSLLRPRVSPSCLLQPLAAFLIPRHAQPGMFSPSKSRDPAAFRSLLQCHCQEPLQLAPCPQNITPVGRLDPLSPDLFFSAVVHPPPPLPHTDGFSYCFVFYYVTSLSDRLPRWTLSSHEDMCFFVCSVHSWDPRNST